MYAVWVPLLMPLLTAPAVRRLSAVLPPRAAAWALAGCAVVLAGCGTAALGLLALAGALRLPPVAALEHVSPPLLGDPALDVVPAACVAGVLLALAGGAVARTVHGLVHEVRAAHGGEPGAGAAGTAGDLSVRADERPYAYALPGWSGPRRTGRVVVSSGMLRALGADEREVLLAHERAHVAGRHHVFLAVGEVAAALHPALRVLRGPLAYALERWADEAAADAVGDRRLAARAIGRAALAAHTAGPGGPGRGRLTPAVAAGPVPRRVAALLESAPRERRAWRAHRVLAVAVVACVALSGVCAVDAASDLHGSVEVAQGEVAGR
ncbi:M56 family metallopeptidase [Streptomyces sp. NPDC002004]